MLNFDDRVWTPPGSRPHLLLTADQTLATYAADLNERARSWWVRHGDGRAWDEVVEPLPAHYLHVTLTWLDQLTAQITQVEWELLREIAADRLAALSPAEVRVGAPMVRSVALEVHVHPTPELNEIAAQARAAVRDVFGDDAAPEPPAYRPHLSVFYSRSIFDDTGLREALLEDIAEGEHTTVLTMRAEAILCDQDTFHPAGFRWDQESAVRIPVGR